MGEKPGPDPEALITQQSLVNMDADLTDTGHRDNDC